MEPALIWFNKGLNPLSLASLKVVLSNELCCAVEDTGPQRVRNAR